MAATTPAYLNFLLDHLTPLGDITQKRMFGGHCLYCNGTVFALVARNALYLKADAESAPLFQARALQQFYPFEDPTQLMNYFQPPPEFFEDPDALVHWGRLAIQAGQRGATRKPRKRVAKTTRPSMRR